MLHTKARLNHCAPVSAVHLENARRVERVGNLTSQIASKEMFQAVAPVTITARDHQLIDFVC
jgi:hypothetical protein